MGMEKIIKEKKLNLKWHQLIKNVSAYKIRI